MGVDAEEQNYNQGGQSAENYNDNKVMMEGAYEPGQYANLPVGADLKELFKSIQRYPLPHPDTPPLFLSSTPSLRPSCPSTSRPSVKLTPS